MAASRTHRRRRRPGPVEEGRTIRADHAAQLRLLDVQATDTSLTQVRHRRATLPELREIAGLEAERARVTRELVRTSTIVSDLEGDTAKAERDLEPVRERLARNEKRIADGSVADPKALSGLVDEVAHLKRRISDLEDSELDLMERLEQAGRERDRYQVQVGELAARLADLAAVRDEKQAALDAQAAELVRQREQIVAEVPADLLGLYAKLSASHAGVGAAELRRGRCTGCQLEVNAADLRQIAAAAPDEVLRCEECGRILVRTPDSGL